MFPCGSGDPSCGGEGSAHDGGEETSSTTADIVGFIRTEVMKLHPFLHFFLCCALATLGFVAYMKLCVLYIDALNLIGDPGIGEASTDNDPSVWWTRYRASIKEEKAAPTPS